MSSIEKEIQRRLKWLKTQKALEIAKVGECDPSLEGRIESLEWVLVVMEELEDAD